MFPPRGSRLVEGITVCRNLRAAGMTEIMDQILHAGGIVRLEALVS